MDPAAATMNAQPGHHGRQSYCLFETAIGPCGIAWNDRGVTRLCLPESSREATEKRLRAKIAASASVQTPPPAIEAVIVKIQSYLAGTEIDFSPVPLDLTGVDAFQHKIYDALRLVGWGHTTSYGELAKSTGAPGMAREVGEAMARNPVPVIIPCHRVLASGNKAGGFSAYGGIFTKERLLSLEGVRIGFAADAPPLPGLFGA